MGLSSLNPFKKSSKESSDDNLAPTKSTSSIANSIRSVKDGIKHATEDGAHPDNLLQGFDLDKNGKNPLPSINSPGIGNLNGLNSNLGMGGVR